MRRRPLTGIELGQRKRLLCLATLCIVFAGMVVAASAQSPQDSIRPLIGGIQIQNDGFWSDAIGSIGFSAYDFEHIPGIGTIYWYGFVTASHLTSESEDVYQPTISGDNYVGDTSRDPPLPRYSDSAFVHTETVLDGPSTTIRARIFSFRSITNYDYVVGYRTRSQMFVGERIGKMGRTTGYTTGQITMLHDGQLHGIINPVLANYDSAGGDSGGTVYQLQQQQNPDYPWPALVYGVHHGWENIGGVIHRIFSPTDGCLTDLNVYVYVT